MQVKMQLFVLLSLVFLTQGAMQDTLEFNTCNETEISEFDECWEKLPEAQYRRIPSNPRKIAVACSVFITGMECVNNWSKKCLPNEAIERLNDSILGSLQIYQALCQNRKFKEEYHQHMDCFNKVSSHWEACNNKFVGMLEGSQDTNSSQDICCIRTRYIQCVHEEVRSLCTKTSSTFLNTLNMFLTKSIWKVHHPCPCTHVFHTTYHSVKSSSQYTANFKNIPYFGMFYAIFICYHIMWTNY